MMNDKNDPWMAYGGPAFPSRITKDSAVESHAYKGMTLRDYFAAHAPPAPDRVMANLNWDRRFEIQSRWAYDYADAMLKAREASNG